jgi:hypothetical protein
MTDLLHRIEAGERWSGDNAEVLRALGYSRDLKGYWYRSGLPLFYGDKRPLDDMNHTLALVPDGWLTEDAYQNPDGTWVWRLSRLRDGHRGPDCEATTPAAALTTAILRAKEADDGQ